MSESDREKQQSPVDATSPGDDSTSSEVETPMLAVWLSLGAIVIAGLYGVYLGTSAKQKPAEPSGASSTLVHPAHEQVAALDQDRLGSRLPS